VYDYSIKITEDDMNKKYRVEKTNGNVSTYVSKALPFEQAQKEKARLQSLCTLWVFRLIEA
jgi:hypothetical protein